MNTIHCKFPGCEGHPFEPSNTDESASKVTTEMQVEPGWAITALLEDSDKFITVYGIKSAEEATTIAHKIFSSGLVRCLQVTKQWKRSKRTPWQSETVLRL